MGSLCSFWLWFGLQFGSAAASVQSALGEVVVVPSDVLLCPRAIVRSQALANTAANRHDFNVYVIF